MRVLFLIFAIIFGTHAQAEEREVLFAGDVKHGGFGGPMVRFTEVNGDTNVMIGGYGAWLINQHLYFGGGGYGTTSDPSKHYDNFSYGGVIFGSFFSPQEALHYFADVSLNVGSLSQERLAGQTNFSSDSFLVIEPSGGVAVNIAEFAKGVASVSYRIVNGVDAEGLSDSDLAGLSLNVGIIFGLF